MRFSGYILFIGIKLRVMSLGCARATSKVLDGPWPHTHTHTHTHIIQHQEGPKAPSTVRSCFSKKPISYRYMQYSSFSENGPNTLREHWSFPRL
jgi:hypothetical protein